MRMKLFAVAFVLGLAIWMARGASTIHTIGVGSGEQLPSAFTKVNSNFAALAMVYTNLPSNNIPGTLVLSGTNCHINAATGTVFRVTATANIGFTIAGGNEGQTITVAITQDGTGNRTAVWTNRFWFGSDITGVSLSTNAGRTDYLRAQYWAASNRWDVLGFVRGY